MATRRSSKASPASHRALCVGIDRYVAPYQLFGCVADASTWAAALAARGFEVERLENENATREAIMAALARHVEAAQPGDVVVFQFSGHGVRVADANGDERDGRDEALCPVDFADGHLIVDDDLRALFERVLDGVNLTCFIDCCHSGTVTQLVSSGGVDSRARFIPSSPDIDMRHRQARRAPQSTRRPPRHSGRRREVLFAACQPDEEAFETEGAGDFTACAVPLLRAAGATTTNAEFADAVVAGFGDTPRQLPRLDCTREAEGHAFLAPRLRA